jgi:CDP-diacylglycerol--glycerol-3-phosphate 3-phosphatidyltransferase/cardiolipin synthase
MMRLDLLIASFARRTLWLTDAYFMGTSTYLSALKQAARDGVDVRLLVPRSSDIRWIATVSRTMYRPLLESGVRVFEWNGPMIHAKTAVADGRWAHRLHQSEHFQLAGQSRNRCRHRGRKRG